VEGLPRRPGRPGRGPGDPAARPGIACTGNSSLTDTPTLVAHDLAGDARAALAALPVAGDRVRVRLSLKPALDFPASEREAAADAVVRALAAAGIVLSDAEDPGYPFRDDLATGLHFVTITRASKPTPESRHIK
jgi:hypothetical protein